MSYGFYYHGTNLGENRGIGLIVILMAVKRGADSGFGVVDVDAYVVITIILKHHGNFAFHAGHLKW